MLILLLLLLLRLLSENQSIEILQSGQIIFAPRSIGTLLYIDLFNSFSRSISLSAVVEQCCRALEQCQSVRLMGGDYGRIPSKTNRSINFLWPAIEWQEVHEPIFCEVSLFFGFRSTLIYQQSFPISIHSIPLGFHFSRSKRQVHLSISVVTEPPFQTPNSPHFIYPRCDEFLNLATNRCETLDHLRETLPRTALHTPLIPLHRPSPRSFRRDSSNKSRFHRLIIITGILSVAYVVLLFIACLFICSSARQHNNDEQSIRTHESKFWNDELVSIVESSLND